MNTFDSIDFEKLKRINIIGASGSGKSTLGKKLSRILNCPVIEIDQLHWKANWQESSDDELFQKIKTAVDSDHWVMDGNYTRATEVKWRNVQTVILLDYSLLTVLMRAVTRAVKRIIRGNEIWPNTGNKETFSRTFLSRDSILLWTITTHANYRRLYRRIVQDKKYSHIQFIKLKNPKDADLLLTSVSAAISPIPVGLKRKTAAVAAAPLLKDGDDYYINEDGNLVFTEKYHLKRGYCCGSGCRHCPWKEKKDNVTEPE